MNREHGWCGDSNSFDAPPREGHAARVEILHGVKELDVFVAECDTEIPFDIGAESEAFVRAALPQPVVRDRRLAKALCEGQARCFTVQSKRLGIFKPLPESLKVMPQECDSVGLPLQENVAGTVRSHSLAQKFLTGR